jgi:hypothetical protein
MVASNGGKSAAVDFLLSCGANVNYDTGVRS